MNFLDYIRIAQKNLLRQKTRTGLTIIAITVGSLSLILMASLIIGIRQSLIDQFKEMGAFNLITVTRDANTPDNADLISSGSNDPSAEAGKKLDDATLLTLKQLPYVLTGTPVSGSGAKTMQLEGYDRKMWADIVSFDPESGVFDMPLLAGRTLGSGDFDKIVVGARFVQDNGYISHPSDLIGKKVVLNFDAGNAPDWGTPPERPPENASKEWNDAQQKRNLIITAEIVGVANNKNMNDNQSYITIAWARKLMTSVYWRPDDAVMQACQERYNKQNQGKKQQQVQSNVDANCNPQNFVILMKEDQLAKNGYGSIMLKINDTANVKYVAQQIQSLGYGVTTAQNMIDNINKILSLVSVVLSVIGGISLFVAAIGIINTMFMATYERTHEIGVMRACGATGKTIALLFSIEASLLGFLGGMLGMLFSILLSLAAKIIVTKFGASLGDIPLDNIGSFPWWLVLAVITFTTMLGLISGLIPAIKASKLDPVEALRYE